MRSAGPKLAGREDAGLLLPGRGFLMFPMDGLAFSDLTGDVNSVRPIELAVDGRPFALATLPETDGRAARWPAGAVAEAAAALVTRETAAEAPKACEARRSDAVDGGLTERSGVAGMPGEVRLATVAGGCGAVGVRRREPGTAVLGGAAEGMAGLRVVVVGGRTAGLLMPEAAVRAEAVAVGAVSGARELLEIGRRAVAVTVAGGFLAGASFASRVRVGEGVWCGAGLAGDSDSDMVSSVYRKLGLRGGGYRSTLTGS